MRIGGGLHGAPTRGAARRRVRGRARDGAGRYPCGMSRHPRQPPRGAPASDDRPPVDDDEAARFRAAIGPVRRLPEAAAPPPRPKPRPWARMAERDEDAARGEFRRTLDAPLLEAGDSLSWRRATIPAQVLRRLARGEYAVEDELDLHGAGMTRAETLVRRFLADAVAEARGCVRIIHGKGLHGPAGLDASGAPVLKNLVDRMLRQRADVLAFHSAPTRAGGTGAVLILLARDRHRKRP
jgi:DNA-nicking Smr family endonuclease